MLPETNGIGKKSAHDKRSIHRLKAHVAGGERVQIFSEVVRAEG